VVAGTEKSPLWISALAFLPVTVAFRVVVGAWEARHLITTLPLVLLFLCEGLAWILSAVPRFRTVVMTLLLVALGSTAIRSVTAMPPKVHLGIDRVAAELATAPEYRDAHLLIVSDPTGEGVFIAEVAAHEQRPGHTIERGSKLLSEASFMGDRYRARFATPAEMMRFFEQGPDRILVLDGIPSEPEHVAEVRSMLAQYPGQWVHLGEYPRAEAPFPIEVFRWSGIPEPHAPEQ
jgi:hypothetical protein